MSTIASLPSSQVRDQLHYGQSHDYRRTYRAAGTAEVLFVRLPVSPSPQDLAVSPLPPSVCDFVLTSSVHSVLLSREEKLCGYGDLVCVSSCYFIPESRVDRDARAVHYGVHSIPESLRHSGENSGWSVVLYGEVVGVACILSLTGSCSQYSSQHTVSPYIMEFVSVTIRCTS